MRDANDASKADHGRRAVKLLTRGAWHAVEPRERTPAGPVLGFVVHYSGALADARGDHDDCPAVMRAFQRAHMAPGGLGAAEGGADIAYNFVGCPHGFIYEGRGWRARTGANGTTDANRDYLSYCLMGGDRAGRRDLTPQARQALWMFAGRFHELYPRAVRVRPHSDFRVTECPGDELRALLPELRKILAAGRP